MNFGLLKERVSIADRKYVVLETIGEGAYAFVYKVKSLERDHSICALKKMICTEREQLIEAKKEIQILSAISHENVIPVLGSEIHQNKKGKHEVLLLLPLYSTSLQTVIDHGPGFPGCSIPDYATVVHIILQCVSGLLAIHSAGYRHADFKPANVLLDDANHAVITDLGSACPLSVRITTRSEALNIQDTAASSTTASFRSPELFDPPNECTIDGKADVWALGCTIFALLFSRTPFESAVEGLSTLAVKSGQFSFPAAPTHHQQVPLLRWPPELLETVRKCLTVNLSLRPTMLEVSQLFQFDVPEPASVNITTLPPTSPGTLHLAAAATESTDVVLNGSAISRNKNGQHSNDNRKKVTGNEQYKTTSAAPENITFADFEHAVFSDVGITPVPSLSTGACECRDGLQSVLSDEGSTKVTDKIADEDIEFGEFETPNKEQGIADDAWNTDTSAAFHDGLKWVTAADSGNSSEAPPNNFPSDIRAADEFEVEWLSASKSSGSEAVTASAVVFEVDWTSPAAHSVPAAVLTSSSAPLSPLSASSNGLGTCETSSNYAASGKDRVKPTHFVTSSDMIDMITLELSGNILKEGPVYVMRPRGFLKMLVRKQVKEGYTADLALNNVKM
jgi:serine/threonine kinase 16